MAEFVGRGREQDELRELLAHHAVVAIRGGVGVGKTALARWFVAPERASAHLSPPAWVALRGLDDPHAIIAATREAVGLGDHLPGTSIQELLDSMFAVSARTLVWDDAAAPAIELLRMWGGRTWPAGWRLIVTTGASADILTTADIPVLELPPLDREDALALIAQLEGARGSTLYDDVLRRTGGNPLMLQLALLSGGSGTIETPGSFVALIEGSSDPAREVLALLAACRGPIDLRALQATTGLPDAATLTELRRRMLVQVEGDRLALTAHAEDAAAQVVPATATIWSTLGAIASRALSTDPLDADALWTACHARVALGDTPDAVRLLEIHGGARAVLARRRRLAALLRDLVEKDLAHSAEVRLLLSREQLRLGDVDAAMRTLDAADLLPASPPLLRKRHLLRLEALLRLGEPERAARELGRARDVPALSPDHASIAAAVVMALAGAPDQARSMLRSLAGATGACPELEASRAAALTMVYLCEERYDRALVCARRSRMILATLDAPFFEGLVRAGEMMALLGSDRVDRAASLVAALDEGEPDNAEGIEPLGHNIGALLRASVLGRRGDLKEALAILEPAFVALDRRADRVARDVLARYLARACIALGRLNDAEEYLRQASGMGAARGLGALLPLVDREWASLAAARGERDEENSRMRSAFARAPGNPFVAIDHWALEDADAPPPSAGLATPALRAYSALRSAERALERGAIEEAIATAEIAERWYGATGLHLEHVRALLLLAEAKVRRGDLMLARNAVATATATAGAHGYRLLAVRAALLEAAISERAGRIESYVDALRRASMLAADDLADDALAECCRRVGLPARCHEYLTKPTAALVRRLGLARPARHLVSVADRVYLLDDDEWPAEGNLRIDLERASVGRDGTWQPWPSMRLRLLERLIEGGDEGVSSETLYLDVWGGREYHALRHRNVIYVAIQRLRAALRPWVEGNVVEHAEETYYRIGSLLAPAIRRAWPGCGLEPQAWRPHAIARWQFAIEQASGAHRA